MKPLPHPVYVTRPLLPDLQLVREQLEEIWDSKWLTNHGAKHNELEAALRQLLKVPHLSVFNNGTIGLLVAIKALDLPLGSEVITTPFTFPATPHSISWNGLRPVFCDITAETMVLDADRIEGLITGNTSAILGVHVYGFPCPVERIERIARKHHLSVIYDSAHGFAAEIDGRGFGCFGDISMFSFHSTKLFHTAEGGCLAYTRPDLERKIYYLRNFGIKNEEEVVDIGINGKMSEVQAAIGLLNLKLFDQERARRVRIRRMYGEALKGIEGITLPSLPSNVSDSCQYFVIKVDAARFGMSRDALYSRLKEYNINTRKYFHPLCSEYQPYQSLPSSRAENLPVANRIKSEVLCLPFYGDLSDGEVGQICSIFAHLHAHPA